MTVLTLEQLYSKLPSDCQYIVMRFASDPDTIDAHKCVCKQLEYNLREFKYLICEPVNVYANWPCTWFHKFILIRSNQKLMINNKLFKRKKTNMLILI